MPIEKENKHGAAVFFLFSEPRQISGAPRLYVAVELLVDGDICEMPLLLNKPPLFTPVTRNENSLLLTTGNHLRKEAASGVRGVVEDTAGAAHSGIRRAALAAHAVHGHNVHAATVGFVRSARNANEPLTPQTGPHLKGRKTNGVERRKKYDCIERGAHSGGVRHVLTPSPCCLSVLFRHPFMWGSSRWVPSVVYYIRVDIARY